MASIDASSAAHQIIELSDTRLSYFEWGSGEPLVLLHHGGPGVTGWSNFSGNLDDFSGYRMLLVDMPGYGDSEIVNEDGGPYASLASKAIAELIDRLGVGPVDLLGHSLGGSVAMRVAVDFPDRLRRLVLVAPTGANARLFTAKPMEGTRLVLGYYPEPTLEKMRAIVSAFLFDPNNPAVDDIAQALYNASLDPRAIAGHRRVLDHHRYPPSSLTREDLERINAATLLIWGRDDRFVGIDDALLFLSGISDCRLMLLTKCGHAPQSDQPKAFATHVKAFLQEE
jgi:pimeloyl-ACP methyl ester carboxylesterase